MECSRNMYMNHNDSYEVVGLKRAIVVDLNDPQKLNRVKLKFVDDDIESVYAPVISSTAGNKVKTVFIPSKYDEVLVGFLDGKIKNPVIIGSLYNSKNKAPVNINSAQNETMVTELSTGTQITTIVNKNDSSIEIKTKKGNTITLKTGSEQQLLIKGGNKISASLDFTKGSFDISATGKISFKTANGATSLLLSKNGMEIKSPTIKINASSKLDVNGGGQLNLKAVNIGINGSGPVKVQSSALTSIEAPMLKLN